VTECQRHLDARWHQRNATAACQFYFVRQLIHVVYNEKPSRHTPIRPTYMCSTQPDSCQLLCYSGSQACLSHMTSFMQAGVPQAWPPLRQPGGL
jgi:hypothetical protein